MTDEKYSVSIINSLNLKIDTLQETVDKLEMQIARLIDMMDQRKDVLKKGKDTIDNIHRVFGSGINFNKLLGSVMKGDDDDEEEVYVDPTQTPVLAIEDEDSDQQKRTNPFY